MSKCAPVSLLGNHCMCEDYSCANEGTCSVIISSSISTTPMFCLDFTLLGTAALLNLLDSTLVSIQLVERNSRQTKITRNSLFFIRLTTDYLCQFVTCACKNQVNLAVTQEISACVVVSLAAHSSYTTREMTNQTWHVEHLKNASTSLRRLATAQQQP